MQNLIVTFAIFLAIFFIGKRFFNNLRSGNTSSCGCSCSGCGSVTSCTSSKKKSNN